MSEAPLIVTVGGFLGAGKTSLILAAARQLSTQGVATAAILNDQAGALVDTQWVREQDMDAEQVTGGCFCCRFGDLAQAAERLREHGPEVIFAEPVGSCTDISATVLQPLKAEYAGVFRLAPFTVLVDPARAARLLAPDADPDLAYLFSKQLEEADIVCLTKADLALPVPELPAPAHFRLSARTGEGVAEWLREALAGTTIGGQKLLEIDYERYARAEAALGWLNCEGDFLADPPLPPAAVIGPVIDQLGEWLAEAGIEIAHLKVIDHAESGYLKAAVCRAGQEPDVEGDLAASPSAWHQVRLNLRAEADPDVLQQVVTAAMDRLRGSWRGRRIESFRPAPPQPVHRFREVAG
jgi:hypothetical protein